MTATAGTRPSGPADRAPGGVDPRIWARRADVARSAGRRRLRWLVALTVVVTAGAGAVGLLHSGWFEARHRLLVGDRHEPPAAIWRAAGVTSATPLLDVSVAAATRGVERLPWVDRAVVRCRWPDTVSIRVTERVPVAVVGRGAAAVVVDRTGRALSRLAALPVAASLPRVVSAAGPVPPGRTVGPVAGPGLVVAAAVPPVLAGRVQQVTVGPGGQVGLRLSGGVGVTFGADQQVAAKFESLAAVLADPVSDPVGRAVVDVTDPGEPVVTPGSSA